MSHPGWVMVSFLTELLSSYGGLGKLPHMAHQPAVTNCANDTEVIDNLLKESYNKHYIPAYPVHVRVDMWVQEVTAVSELTQDFEIDLYINEFWEDPALVFDHMNPCKSNISFDDKVLQKLWIPNTCFINSKTASIHESPFRNVFLMIFSNSTIWTNYRMKLTGPCDMNLKRFPFDQQKCFLTFESFNYNTGEVRMEWNQPYPVMLLKPIELPDFVLVNFSVIAIEQMYPAGWWDELTVAFVFKRRYGWYLVQVYSVGYVTIFISWISFYLGSRAIPARTMLGVNSLLAMTFQFGNIIRNLPRVSYVKLAVVGFMTRNEGLQLKRMKKPKRHYISASPYETHDYGWKEMPSPRIGLRQFWVDKQFNKNLNKDNDTNDTMAPGITTNTMVDLHHRRSCYDSAYSTEFTTSSATCGEFDVQTHSIYTSPQGFSPTSEHCRAAKATSGAASKLSAASMGGLVSNNVEPTVLGALKTADAANYIHHRHKRDGARRVHNCFSWLATLAKLLRSIQPETVDKYSAILFPTTYFIFNLGYWIYYLSDLSSVDEMRII